MNLTNDTPFAPSELALLHGEHFAPKGNLLDKTLLLHVNIEVSARHLARALLLVALLANEQAGVLGLEARPKSALLGLAKSQVVYVEPGGAAAAWPSYSLEAGLRPLAEQLRAKGKNEVQTLVHALLQHDTANPWQSLIELVQAGLAQRGLLQTQEKKQFLAATRVCYTLPPSTAERAAGQPVEMLQHGLADGERARPELHKALVSQIESGLKRRLEQSTSV